MLSLPADQGLAEAQYNLGVMYANSIGVPKDYNEAAKWYRKAADQGFSEAQHNLNWMIVHDQGVPQNYPHRRYSLARLLWETIVGTAVVASVLRVIWLWI